MGKIRKKFKNSMKYVGKKTLYYSSFLPKKTSINLIKLLIKLGLYKHAISIRLFFMLFPFLLLIVVDGAVIAFLVTTINIFVCSIVFLATNVSKEEAYVNGNFDYGKYKNKKIIRETIAIIVCFAFVMFNTFIGHFFVEKMFKYLLV